MSRLRGIYLPGDLLTAIEELRDLARQFEARAVNDKERYRWSAAAEELTEAADNIAAAWAVEDFATPADRANRRNARDVGSRD